MRDKAIPFSCCTPAGGIAIRLPPIWATASISRRTCSNPWALLPGSSTIHSGNAIALSTVRPRSAIAFPEWIVEDPGRRAQGLEQVRRDMEAVAQIGGRRIAMPPAGVQHENGIALSRISERDQIGR